MTLGCALSSCTAEYFRQRDSKLIVIRFLNASRMPCKHRALVEYSSEVSLPCTCGKLLLTFGNAAVVMNVNGMFVDEKIWPNPMVRLFQASWI